MASTARAAPGRGAEHLAGEATTITPQTAGAALVVGDPVYAASGQWLLSRGDTGGTMPSRGLAPSVVASGAPFHPVAAGVLAGLVFVAADIGKKVFVGASGGVTTTAPSASGTVQQETGFVLSTTEVLVDFRKEVTLQS